MDGSVGTSVSRGPDQPPQPADPSKLRSSRSIGNELATVNPLKERARFDGLFVALCEALRREWRLR